MKNLQSTLHFLARTPSSYHCSCKVRRGQGKFLRRPWCNPQHNPHKTDLCNLADNNTALQLELVHWIRCSVR
jgi:hypothetical protein